MGCRSTAGPPGLVITAAIADIGIQCDDAGGEIMTVRFDKSTECDTIFVSEVSTQHYDQQVVEDPVPMTQEESMHAPTIDDQCCHHRVEVEQSGDTCVPRTREEVALAPKIITSEAWLST